MTGFARHVLHVVRRIPHGRVATYGDIAAIAGRPGAARAVGTILRESSEPGLPYHRVVAAGGLVGGYGGNPHEKVLLLAREGLVITRGRIKQFDRHRWQPRSSPARR